jgi:molecular chaperone DnaK
MTRDHFEDLTRDLVDRTSLTVRHALTAASVTWDQIDRVLLIGGSTRMPSVQQMLRSQSGKEPDCSISPDEAVAFGAALHAQTIIDESHGRVPQFRLRNVNAHSLGVVGTHPTSGHSQNVIIVPRNTLLPVTLQRTFRTQQRGQTSVLIRIVEGEVPSPDDCVQLGQLSIYNLPVGLPAKTPIEVFFHYKANGRLTVSVKMVGMTARPSLQIARENSLSKAQLKRWRQLISGLAPDTVGQDES